MSGMMLTLAEILSVAAFAISVSSLLISARAAFLDRPRLKVTSIYCDEDEYGPAQISIAIINKGRRPAILRLIGGITASGESGGTFIDHDKGGHRLGEHERYEIVIRQNDTFLLTPDDNLIFETLYIEDSLGMRHEVPKSKEHIKRLRA